MQQSGTYQGSFTLDGKTYDADGWFGIRDRTWGIRESLEFSIWSAVHFPTRTLHLYHFEAPDGTVLYSNGGFSHESGTGPELRIVSHDFELAPGERVPTQGVCGPRDRGRPTSRWNSSHWARW